MKNSESIQMGQVFVWNQPTSKLFERPWKKTAIEILNFQQSSGFHIVYQIYSTNNMNKGAVPLNNRKYFKFVRLWCLSNIKKILNFKYNYFSQMWIKFCLFICFMTSILSKLCINLNAFEVVFASDNQWTWINWTLNLVPNTHGQTML